MIKAVKKWLFLGVFVAFKIKGQSLGFINTKIFDGEGYLKSDSILVKNGIIEKLGDSSDIKPMADEVIDLKNQFLLPGFIESHAHMMSLGKSLHTLDLTGKTLEEITTLVKAQKLPKDQWVVGRGWDQNLWPEKSFPHKSLLDNLGVENPIFLLRVDGHAAWINSKALSMAKITGETKVEGGKILLDDNGKPSGVLLDYAIDIVKGFMGQESDKELKEQLNSALKKVASLGITSFHDAGVSKKHLELFKNYAQKNELTTRIYAMLDGQEEDLVAQYFKNGPENINDILTVRSIKYFADGALGSKGALMLNDYHDQKGYKGLSLIPQKTLFKKTSIAIKHGFQVGVHAIGDGANRMVLDVFEEALTNYQKSSPRLRIEHAQVIDPQDQSRFAKLNVIASMQPVHCTSDMAWAPDRIGQDFEGKAYPWQSLFRQNAVVAFGSDAPVEDINPILGIFAATTRQSAKDIFGKPFVPKERVTLGQALKGYYQNAAYAEFNEHKKGKIKEGYLADFVIFKEDIFKLTKKRFLQAKPEKTYLGGKEVFSKNLN